MISTPHGSKSPHLFAVLLSYILDEVIRSKWYWQGLRELFDGRSSAGNHGRKDGIPVAINIEMVESCCRLQTLPQCR